MSKVRTRRAGSVTPLGDGRFWARLTVNGKRQSLGVHPTEEIAQGAIDSAIKAAHAKATGGVAVAGGLTLGTYAKEVLDRRGLSGFRGVRRERYNWDRHLATHAIADRLVVDIRPADIWRLYRELGSKPSSAAGVRPGKKLGHRTVARIVSLLSTILLESTRDELRPDNPCTGVKPPRRKDDDADEDVHWDYLRPDEQHALATCEAIPKWARLMMRVAWGTGLRQGEQWNLELRDIHAGKDEKHPRVFVRYGSKGKSPKSGKTRTVDLFGDGLAAMREWLEFLPTYAPDNPHGLAFPRQRGSRRDPRAPSVVRLIDGKPTTCQLLREWLATAGIKRRLRWHDLRHTFASSLVSGFWGHKWALDEVRDQMGHSSVTVTEMYAHLSKDGRSTSAARTHGVTVRVTEDRVIGA